MTGSLPLGRGTSAEAWSCKEIPDKTRATYLRQCTSTDPVLRVRRVVGQTSRILSLPSSVRSVNVVVDLTPLSCWKRQCQAAVARIELVLTDSSYSADAGVESHCIVEWHGVVKHPVKQRCHEAPHQQQELILFLVLLCFCIFTLFLVLLRSRVFGSLGSGVNFPISNLLGHACFSI